MPDPNPSLKDSQYEAWGVLVHNTNLKSSHVANGLVQTLRALPILATEKPDWSTGDIPGKFDNAVRSALTKLAGPAWKPDPAAVSLSVTKSNNGSMYLDGEPAPDAPKRDARVVEAGLALLADRFVGANPRLTRTQHELIADAINADRTVMVAGGLDPTTPGLSYAGYTSTHSLKLMHGATFLGALANGGSVGDFALRRLHELMRSESDVHSQLIAMLGLRGQVEWPSLRSNVDLSASLPFPDGESWERFARVTSAAVCRLLAWHGKGAAKQGLLMSVADLAGLSLLLKMIGAGREPGHSILLVCHGSRHPSARVAVAVAQRSLRARLFQLDAAAEAAGLVLKKEGKDAPDKRYLPSAAARTLGLATGWLFPRNAQGGARHSLAPGMRQFTTLARALVDPGEDIPWEEFHDRALGLGVVLGGADDSVAAELVGVVGGPSALRKAGEINQRFLISLGLARHESDGVVRVTGGA